MAKLRRDDVCFAALGTLAFLVLGGLCALGRWYLIVWYLGHCGQSTACTAADVAANYWWAVFLAFALAIAWPLNHLYQLRLRTRSSEPT